MMRGQRSLLVHQSTFAAPGAKNKSLRKLFVSRIILESDSLTITDVTENDAGVYTCITNTTLDQDSASAELTVVGKFGSPGAASDSERSCAADCLSAFQSEFPEPRLHVSGMNI